MHSGGEPLQAGFTLDGLLLLSGEELGGCSPSQATGHSVSGFQHLQPEVGQQSERSPVPHCGAAPEQGIWKEREEVWADVEMEEVGVLQVYT